MDGPHNGRHDIFGSNSTVGNANDVERDRLAPFREPMACAAITLSEPASNVIFPIRDTSPITPLNLDWPAEERPVTTSFIEDISKLSLGFSASSSSQRSSEGRPSYFDVPGGASEDHSDFSDSERRHLQGRSSSPSQEPGVSKLHTSNHLERLLGPVDAPLCDRISITREYNHDYALSVIKADTEWVEEICTWAEFNDPDLVLKLKEVGIYPL